MYDYRKKLGLAIKAGYFLRNLEMDPKDAADLADYLLSFFGLLMLIPALMAPSRPPPTRGSEPAKQEPWRITPKPQPSAATPQPHPTPQANVVEVPSPQPSQYASYSPALFPNSMFPPLSFSGSVLPKPDAPAKPSERDEVVETGAMLALLRLVFG